MRALAVFVAAATGLALVACAEGALPPRSVADPANPNAPESPFTPPSAAHEATSAGAPSNAPSAAPTTSAMPGMSGMEMP